MNWIRPDHLTSEYNGFMKGRGIQVWDTLRASAEGDLKKVRAFLSEDPGLANCEFAYFTPLHFAVREGHTELVRLFLDAGADPTSKSGLEWQERPLVKARDRGHDEIAALLEEAMRTRFRASPAGKEICDAVRDGDGEKVHALLDGQPTRVNDGDERGNTPLHWAVMTRRMTLIHALIDRGADLEATRADGRKPIHLTLHGDYWHRRKITAMEDDSVLLGILLARGAEYDANLAAAIGDLDGVRRFVDTDPQAANQANSAGYRPLSYAARKGFTRIVELLLQRGADPNASETDAPRGLALYEAVANDHLDCVKLLLEHGADPDAQVESSGNPLHRAIGNPTVGDRCKKEIVDLLFAYGATAGASHYALTGQIDILGELLKVDPSIANSGGDYGVLCMAAGFAPIEVVRLLLRYDVDLNRPWYGNNYMGYACRLRTPDRVEVVKLLLDSGVDPNLSNWLGISYLHVQAMNGRKKVVELLLDRGADINARDDEYCSTPLGWAARWGQVGMVELLLDRGAKTNLPDEALWATPPAWAEKKGYPEVSEILRRHGATG